MAHSDAEGFQTLVLLSDEEANVLYSAQDAGMQPLFFTQLSQHPFLGYVHTQNTPKPTPKHPFSCPGLENGQNKLSSGQLRSQLGKMLEK